MSVNWKIAAAAGVLVGGAALYLGRKPTAGAPARICDPSFLALEQRSGRRLYAPTWLPKGMVPMSGQSRQGVHRVLINYEEPVSQRSLLLAQEFRQPDRDAYHEGRLIPTADLEAAIGAQRGYFMRGSSGERRLLWHTNDAWLLLSTFHLSDAELLKVARSIR
jgi:hypothetical protein